MADNRISTTIITYNEEKNIRDCINSIKSFSDDILVVDSLSTDKTVGIVKKMGCRILSQKFLGHVKQKDLAVKKAKYDMVFCIDADERATPELQKNILTLKRAGFLHDGYRVNRRNWYLFDWLKIGGWYPDKKIRLFNRTRGGWAGENPHDMILLKRGSKITDLHEDLLHYTYKTLSEHAIQIDKFSASAAQAKFIKGRNAGFFRLLLTPIFSFVKMFIGRGGFTSGTRGLVVSIMSGYSDFLKYAKLWELNRRSRAKKR